MVNGLVNTEMDLVCKFGQMEQNMKVNGKIIMQTEKENFFILMVIFMKVIL